MNTHSDKTQINQSRAVANEPTQKSKGSSPKVQIINNRPEAAAQLKLQEMANDYTSAKPFQLMNADPVPDQFVKRKLMTQIYKIEKVENDIMYLTNLATSRSTEVKKEKWDEWEETTNNMKEGTEDPVAAAMLKWSQDQNVPDDSSRIYTPSQGGWDYTATFVWNNVNGYEIKAHVHYTEKKQELPALPEKSDESVTKKKEYVKSPGNVWGKEINKQGPTPPWVIRLAPDNPLELREYKP